MVSPAFLAEAAARRKPGQRGPGKKPAKEQVSLRIDPDVLAAYKTAGPRWRRVVAETLRAHMPNRGSAGGRAASAPRKAGRAD